MKMKQILLIFTIISGWMFSAGAATAESVAIEFLVCSPGSEIYELEGHAGLRIHSPHGDDVTLNWGLFDFDSDNFVYRFVKGETDYMVGAIPTHYFLRHYAGEGRSVTAHELNLTPIQKQRIIDAVELNMRPENRVYRYNYVKDNCSTRPLTMIENAVGDTIVARLPEGFNLDTYREAMTYFHGNYPWYQLGIDIALGNGIDRLQSPRDMLFAPALANMMLPEATIAGKPLVKQSYYLTGGSESNAVLPPTPWYLSPMLCMSALLLAAIAVTLTDFRRRTVSRWFDSLFYSLLTIAAAVVTFLVFFSSHEATSPNYEMLIFNPLCIIGAIGIWIKRLQSLVFCWQIVNFAALILLLIAWGVSAQELNHAVILLIITDLIRSSSYIYIKCPRKKQVSD